MEVFAVIVIAKATQYNSNTIRFPKIKIYIDLNKTN